MPTTLIGVAILIVLLGPGFCYVAGQEKRFPARPQTPFRETVQLAAASIALNLLALLVLWLGRTVWTHRSPDLGQLLTTPHRYWIHHYRLIAGWAAFLFLFACGVGFISGLLIRPSTSKFTETSWWRMFEQFPDSKKWVGCELIDGAYLSGELASYSPEPNESADRELLIRSPKYRGPDMTVEVPLGARMTAVSARQIRFLSVTYGASVDHAPLGSRRQRAKEAWQVLKGKPAEMDAAADPDPT